MHEIAHFIRLYIYKYTGKSEYEKSFVFDDNTDPDIGFFIEKNLFGRVVNEINILEALYLLDINNYYKEINQFSKEFLDLRKNNQKFDINKISNNVEIFLNNFEIDIKNLKNIKTNNYLLIKGNGNNFVIGKNNDRGHFSQFVKESSELLKKIMETK